MDSSESRIGRLKGILTAAVFVLIIGGLFVANMIYTPPAVSKSERRTLATRPPLTITDAAGETRFNADFMSGVESWALDSFAWRDGFRRIKAHVLNTVLRQTDNNGIYVVDGNAAKVETLDPDQAALTAQKIERVRAQMLEGLNVYYALVPDKGQYLGAARGYPTLDYAQAEEILAQNVTQMTYIPLLDTLAADSYYSTDLHWRQEKLDPVAQALGEAMGFEPVDSWQTNDIPGFYGVYYGQSALPLGSETLRYLTADWMTGVTARYLNDKTLEMDEGPIYWPERFDGVDPYDVYLKGAQPLITLENPAAAQDRTLYLFRDSFSSSLGSWLAGSYSKVVLIDLRYLAASAVPMLVDFEPGSDALFLYSSQIIGDSSLLLVS